VKLAPVTDSKQISSAVDLMFKTLRQHGKPYRISIGWRDGSGMFDVTWHEQQGYWSMKDPKAVGKRYWCIFGTGSPEKYDHFAIVVEMNIPLAGYDRTVGGGLMRDEAGSVFLTHSGRVGGGRKGIGKDAFLNALRGANSATVSWPDGIESDVLVIGRVDSPRLPAQIGNFVQEVERFKESVTGGAPPLTSNAVKDTFNPEFAGTKRPHTPAGSIEAECDHGIVVNELYKVLKDSGRERLGNDRHRDLYIMTASKILETLFEIKTDAGSGSTYQGVGQLFIHGAAEVKTPRFVLVVPGWPSPRTKAALTRLGVRVLTYDWEGDVPLFRNLKEVLAA
jgi:hypothetical protein